MGDKQKDDGTTVGHIPDALAEVLFQPLVDGHITVSGRVTGQSRSAPEGVWVQGGGVEIPCNYEVSIEKGLKKLRKDLKRQILLLK